MVKPPRFTYRQLDEKVRFERNTRTRKATGGFAQTWLPIVGAPTWAHVEQRGGSERQTGDRTQVVRRYRIVVRWTDDIKEGDRVRIGPQVCNITFVEDLGFDRDWLQIDAESGVGT